ncbi:MAG TPA: SCO family protein [Candidatus Rubrimentiphilum sp.]|nr:SCO family protein [Candidatus Rubrimentiphilum sp.]
MLDRFKHAGAAILAVTIAAPALPAHANAAPVLIDQRGERFTFSTFAGTPLLVTFVAAHCTDACPLVNAQFSAAAHRFAREHRKVHLLTITLDPEHDPPAVMRALAGTFSADPSIWTLASGSVTDVHRVMRGFGVVAQRGRKGYADVHTTFVYLVDARGMLRKTILASSNLGAQLVALVR